MRSAFSRFRPFIFAVASVVSLAVLSGCYTHRITVGKGGHVERSARMEMFFLNGLIGTADINARKICGSDNATIEIKHSILNQIIGRCTSGLVTPTQVTVYCGESDRRAEMTLSKEEQRALVQSQAFRDAVEDQAPELVDDVDAAKEATLF